MLQQTKEKEGKISKRILLLFPPHPSPINIILFSAHFCNRAQCGWQSQCLLPQKFFFKRITRNFRVSVCSPILIQTVALKVYFFLNNSFRVRISVPLKKERRSSITRRGNYLSFYSSILILNFKFLFLFKIHQSFNFSYNYIISLIKFCLFLISIFSNNLNNVLHYIVTLFVTDIPFHILLHDDTVLRI